MQFTCMTLVHTLENKNINVSLQLIHNCLPDETNLLKSQPPYCINSIVNFIRHET